ncbi:hypothetical protein OG21DRAFT_1510884 [Imleria badia]|nr:hypothetical protein OG21DRAFT_1510884 [Imleria badia]
MFQLWRLCVVFSCCSLAFSPMTFVVGDKDHVYLAIPSSSFICVLSGADVDRCVLFSFPYRTDDQCDRRNTNAQKKSQ